MGDTREPGGHEKAWPALLFEQSTKNKLFETVTVTGAVTVQLPDYSAVTVSSYSACSYSDEQQHNYSGCTVVLCITTTDVAAHHGRLSIKTMF